MRGYFGIIFPVDSRSQLIDILEATLSKAYQFLIHETAEKFILSFRFPSVFPSKSSFTVKR